MESDTTTFKLSRMPVLRYIDLRPTIDSWLARRPDSTGELHQQLMQNMSIYRFLPEQYQAVVRQFTVNFYRKKSVWAHPDTTRHELLLLATAANASLVGAAQRTHYFESVEWIYFCQDDLELDGDAFQTSTVRLNANQCLAESRKITAGRNLVVHEFSHILDHLFGISGSTQAFLQSYEWYLEYLQCGSVVIADCFTPLDQYELPVTHTENTVLHSPEEFFAVASEAFFTNPQPMRDLYPELYDGLRSIYGLDMANYLG